MKSFRHNFCMVVSAFLFIFTALTLTPKAGATSVMYASESCYEFIKKTEGFSSQPYYDYNQYTVGYGTRCPTEKYFEYKANGIPKKEAEALLNEFITDIETAIHKKLIDKYGLTLSQHQFDALVSFSFNVGTGWMTYNSSLRNAILRNVSDEELVYAFSLYCTAGGKYLPSLITRRLCEANIYLNGIYSQRISDNYGYVYYEPNGGALTYRVQGYICANNTTPAADVKRTGDEFLGWYTELSNGSLVTALDKSLSGQTLFARWKSSESPDQPINSSITVRVTGDIVNVRNGPGTNYGVVHKAYYNEVLNISYITQLTNMKWGKYDKGWICLDYTNYDNVLSKTDPTDTDTSTPPSDEAIIPEKEHSTPSDDSVIHQDIITGIVKVNDALRIRSGPGTHYGTVGFLFNGKEVDIYDQQTAGSTVWGQIEKGWVSMDYIVTNDPYPGGSNTEQAPQQPPSETENEDLPQPSEQESQNEPDNKSEEPVASGETNPIQGIIIADALRIRSGAGTANPIVGFYYQNDVVIISEKILVGFSSWGKTSNGWINMDYVRILETTQEPTQPSSTSSKTVIGDCLRVRKGPGTEYKIAELLYYGDPVEILETKTVEGTLWGKVSNGWVCMEYVS